MYTVGDCRNFISRCNGGGPLLTMPDGDERDSILNSSDLVYIILGKYFFSQRYLKNESVVQNMMISQFAIEKASEQIKKIEEAMENEIKQYLETGEINLGFKDMELYERVQMLEGQSKDQTTVIVGLNDKIASLENELREQKDQVIAIRYLLELQMEQRTTEIEESQVANELLIAKKEEEFEKKISEINTTFLCFFLPSIVILIIAVIVSLYIESKQSAYYPENRTLIMDRSS
jgi:hypothetical protein